MGFDQKLTESTEQLHFVVSPFFYVIQQFKQRLALQMITSIEIASLYN